VRRIPGFADKAATQQLAAALQREADLTSIGKQDCWVGKKVEPLVERVVAIRRSILESNDETSYLPETASRKSNGRVKVECDYGAELINDRVRFALYRSYRGRCQYCATARWLPLSLMHLEHIIPVSIPLPEVPVRLKTTGVSAELIDDFCSNLLPPRHNCVLNYSLACVRCNVERKNGRLLHVASLEAMLKEAKRRAPKLLRCYYNRHGS